MSQQKIGSSANERMAFKVVGDGLGVEVVPYDDNSRPRMVDALIPPDGALEVIGDHDSDFNALWKRLNRSGHGVEIPTLKHGWHVGIAHSANVNRLTKALPAFLLGLEAHGIRSTTEAPIRPPYGATADIDKQMEALGIQSARQDSAMPKGRVQFWAMGWTGTSDADNDVLADWVGTVLANQTDVASKLGDHPGVTQRHAFIWATVGTAYAVQRCLEADGPLPEPLTAPELPGGITHIWIAGGMSGQGVVAWFPDRGWWRTGWRWPITDRNRELAANIAAAFETVEAEATTNPQQPLPPTEPLTG
jgi:hypothetical protein